jgi:hypothetical protein
MKNPAWLTLAYYAAAIAAAWFAIAKSGPANGGPNGGMVFAAGLIVVSCVLALVSLARTIKGNPATRGSTFIHLMAMISLFGWWSTLR